MSSTNMATAPRKVFIRNKLIVSNTFFSNLYASYMYEFSESD